MAGEKFSWRKAFASVIGATVLLVGVPALTVSAAGVDDFPYRGTVNKLDPWGFYPGYCTSFVAFRLTQEGVVLHGASLKGPNGKTAFFGNGGSWDAAARSIGYVVDTHPTVGSVAVWHGGGDHAWGGGPVALVMAGGGGGAAVRDGEELVELPALRAADDAGAPIHPLRGCDGRSADLASRPYRSGATRRPSVSDDRLRSAALGSRHRVSYPGHLAPGPAHHGGLPGPISERHQRHWYLGPPEQWVLRDRLLHIDAGVQQLQPGSVALLDSCR